ncbi:hypothetical protein BDQ17DRAFT_1441685 [Cyathus striatus]|nr:hypothetical protein BDQ17DRAFT_1441685 [Cyathus striatus]
MPVENNGIIKVKKVSKWLPGCEPPHKFEPSFVVDNELDYGRCGITYSTSLEYIWDYSNPDADHVNSPGSECIPPVVMKAMIEDSYASLASEALNYKKLKSLQDITVPHCYGWCKVTLDDRLYVPGAHSNEDLSKKCKVSLLLLEHMGEPLSLKETDKEM